MVETSEGYHLSPQQRRLWTLQQWGFVYNTCCLVRVDGALQADRLQQALAQTVQRHEILRTLYRKLSGVRMPLQMVAASLSPEWHEVDLTALEASRQEAELAQLFACEKRHSFDLENNSPLSATLVRLSPQASALLLTLPSLCGDAWSLNNLLQEIIRAYTDATNEEDQEEVLQYADVSEWLNTALTSEEEEANQAREYWSRCDLSSVASLASHSEENRFEVSAFGLAEMAVPLKPGLTIDLEELPGGIKVSSSVFLSACWQTLLFRSTGQSHITLGYCFDGRQLEDLQSAIGLLAKCLPVSNRFDESTRFGALLVKDQETLQAAAEQQEYFSWDQVTAGAESAGVPYFPYGFEYLEEASIAPQGDVRFRLLQQYSQIERFHLLLSCRQTPQGLTASLHYDPSFYAQEEVERLAQQFAVLIDSALAQPQALVDTLSILPEDQRHQLVVEWNAPRVEYPSECVHTLFEAHVQRAPEAPAVAYEGQTLTYAELNAKANQLAHYLMAQGVGPDTLVGLYVERSVEMMIGLLGILKAGGAYVPLDPAYPSERVTFMLEDSGAALVLTQDSLQPTLKEWGGRRLCLDSEWKAVGTYSVANPEVPVEPQNLVYVIYTSGSTGKPKGVLVEHGGLSHYVHAIHARLKLSPGSRYASVSTLAADLGNTVVFGALCGGGALHLISSARATDAEAFAAYMRAEQIDCVKIVPSHLAALLSGSDAAGALPRQVLVLGGEASSWALVDRISELAPECRILNHYGPTETTVGVVSCEYRAGERPADSRGLPLGRALGNTQIYILDRHRNPVPLGVVGELYIGGPQVARGYLNRPELTQERFIAHPFDATSGGRLYRTGDLVRYLADGNLEFIGRGDDQVKIRGYRIELGEIESRLREHPEIREAVVLAREDASGDRRLVSYLVGEKRARVEREELREFLRERLPQYMFPTAFLWLDQLPLSPNGKIDRQALLRLEMSEDEDTSRYVGPRNAIEESLCNIWMKVLGMERVGIHDNFFDLGGHSLLAVRLLAEIRKAFGKTLPLVSMFQGATVAQLAEMLDEEKETVWPTLIPIQPLGSRPALFCVGKPNVNTLGYVFLGRRFAEDQPLFGLQSQYRTEDRGPYNQEEYDALAAEYIEALREVQPEGPYHLVGMCQGGHIAFEMARQLESQGEKVAFLGMLDVWPLENTVSYTRWKLWGYGRVLMSKSKRLIARARGRKPQPRPVPAPEVAANAQPEEPQTTLRNVLKLWEQRYWPGPNWKPTLCQCPITVFKVRKQRFYRIHDSSLGWYNRTTGGVEVIPVPGEHNTLLREPHAGVLAQHLKDSIDKAGAE